MLFRYLAACWRYRHLSLNGFLRAGIGLEDRCNRLYPYWSEHLSRTRAAQARWAEDCHGQVLTVLGAGPLFDFNYPALSHQFDTFRLVDANPLAQSYWSRLNTPVEPIICDISNCLAAWGDAVKRSKLDWEQTLTMIRELGSQPVASYCPNSDAVLSLNILSQLEVGWQEMLEPILRRRFGDLFVQEHEQEWLSAIKPSSQTLVEQHLAGLERSAAHFILLISDVEYIDYTGRKFSIKRWEPTPIEWTASGWHPAADITYEVTPALEGVDLNDETFSRWIPSYKLNWREDWLWHLSPNGTEASAYGQVHRVAALSLVRS